MSPANRSTANSSSRWTPQQAGQIRLTLDTTFPLIDRGTVRATAPGYHVWDSWLVTDLEGAVTGVGGWFVLIYLSAPASLPPEERHHAARLRYAVSQDRRVWRDCGPLFPEKLSLGSRDWAGSTVYDSVTNRLTVFYTTAGRRGDVGVSYEQRIVAGQADVELTPDGVSFTNWGRHRVVLEPDGRSYKPTAGTGGGPGKIDAFRDPSYFRDPETGKRYLLFTASLAAGSCVHDGAIGVAGAVGEDLFTWEISPPLITADCVNKELERPHVVVQDGRYYLFFSTHTSTFQPPLTGPEGLYGFTSRSFNGPWEPLNGSGLVAGNPATAPFQAYSWLVLPDLSVLSFVNYVDLGPVYPETADPALQARHFVGSLAPLARLRLAGVSAKLEAVGAEEPSFN